MVDYKACFMILVCHIYNSPLAKANYEDKSKVNKHKAVASMWIHYREEKILERGLILPEWQMQLLLPF